MRLRHALIPYLYTMAWRNHAEHMPLVRPMYHTHPAQEAAYHCPDQYWFGGELVVAPFLSPADKDTRLSRAVVWLPEGNWFNFFSGERYAGGGWHALYGDLKEIPVFARAGAIVPLAVRAAWSDTDNPRALAVHLFPGADNEFLLYEDDGRTASCRTPIRQEWVDDGWRVTIAPAQENSAFLPAERTFDLHFHGVAGETAVTAELDGDPISVTAVYDRETATLNVLAPAKKADQTLAVQVAAGDEALQTDDYRLPASRRLVRAFRMDSWEKQRLDRDLPAIINEPRLLANYQLSLTAEQIRALAEVVTGSGHHHGSTRRAGDAAIVVWNNDKSDAVSFKLAAEDFNQRPEISSGSLPKFAVLHVGENVLRWQSGDQPAGGQISVGEWFDSLAERVGTESTGGTAVVQFDIRGPLGRTAFLTLADGVSTGSALPELVEGISETPDVTIVGSAEDWLSLINGLISPEEAFLSGNIRVAGNIELALRLADAISFAPPSTYLAERWRFDVNYADALTVPLGNA